MIYRGSLLHGGGANTSSHSSGVLLEYVCAWLRPQESHLIAVPCYSEAATRPPPGAVGVDSDTSVHRLRRRPASQAVLGCARIRGARTKEWALSFQFPPFRRIHFYTHSNSNFYAFLPRSPLLERGAAAPPANSAGSRNPPPLTHLGAAKPLNATPSRGRPG